jgi:hypothetical protein
MQAHAVASFEKVGTRPRGDLDLELIERLKWSLRIQTAAVARAERTLRNVE